MYSIGNYKELILEIEISKTRLKWIEEQKEQLTKIMNAWTSPLKELKAMVYDDMPKGGHAVEYERYLEGMATLENLELIENRILNGMLDIEKVIDIKLQTFDGLEYKVAYLKAKGKTLQEIAIELGYSPGYIQNISAKVSKRESV